MAKTIPYRPSNGTEGMHFESKFCDHCQNNPGKRCGILFHAIFYGIDDPEYPAEWIMDEGDYQSGRCTAFAEKE